MSPAFTALIWWVIPAAGLIGALGYVLWVTKFQSKYRQETNRSIDTFQRFQQTFHDPAGVRVIDHKTGKPVPPVVDINQVENTQIDQEPL